MLGEGLVQVNDRDRVQELLGAKVQVSHRSCGQGSHELTSKIYFFPNSSSLLHPVSKQNSVPTRQISPVRRQTTVGVPENEMSLFSSTRVRWIVRSTKICIHVDVSQSAEKRIHGKLTSSSSVRGI